MEQKNDQEEVIDELPEIKEDEEDLTDWKALAQKNQGIAKRLKTKLEKTKMEAKAKPEEPKSDKKADADKLDYAQKAFLIANGIKGEEEHQLAFDIWKRLGGETDPNITLDLVVEDEFFMSKLKEMRAAKAINEATPPSSSTRPSSSPKDEVGYWVAKGELPPADQPKLRQEVVNAKLKSQTDGSPFSNNSIVGAPK